MNLSENIKKIRKENNLSQEALAEKLGVSRQSVSKWESGQAYPEMDKVLQICDLFNLNMDELMKSDLKEVRESKQNKANLNKYVDDFFDYITKTIDMFSALKFKDKVKCLCEQAFIALTLFIVLLMKGSFLSEIFRKIFGFINGDTYWVIYNIFQAIYLVVAIFIFLAVFLHIFKIRYLDYYVIVKEEKEEPLKEAIPSFTENKNVENKEKNKIELSKKQEKIVIRDPNHSSYKFLSGLLKCALFFIKLIAFFIGIVFLGMLLALGISLVLPFLVINAGYLFWGMLLSVISCIIINLIILKLLLNFIINKKSKKTLISVLLACSIIVLGLGIGSIAIGLTNISYVEILDENELVTDKVEIEMTDNLILDIDYYENEVEYVISDVDNIIIEVTHSKYLKPEINNYGNVTYMYTNFMEYEILDIIKSYIDDLNDYKIVNREGAFTKVYISKDNLNKLENNKNIRENIEIQHQKEIDELKKSYELEIDYYVTQIDQLIQRIEVLENNY